MQDQTNGRRPAGRLGEVRVLRAPVNEVVHAPAPPPALTDEELEEIAARTSTCVPFADSTSPAQQSHDVHHADIRRLLDEIRRLRAFTDTQRRTGETCEICGRPGTQVVKVILGQRWSPRCEEHCH